MASSATFLEEALSTDVDESAVSAIVGSLENQLGTPTSIVSCQSVSSTTANQNLLHSGISNGSSTTVQKHGAANGQSDTMSLILNSEPNKSITSSSHQIGNITPTVSNSVVQGVVSSSGFPTQIQSSIGIVQTSNVSLGKTQDGLKTVFATNAPNSSVLSSPRLTYPTQNVGSLPNGNFNVAVPMSSVLNVTNSNIQGMVSQTFSQTGGNYHKISPIVTDQNKSGAAINPVIVKSSICNNVQSTSTSSQMSTAISVSGSPLNTSITLAKSTTASGAQIIVGNSPITSNVQLLNFRTTAPNQQGNKTSVAPRFVIPQAVVGARPGQPGIALQGKTFVVKTENGQYQILQFGPPTANSSVGQNNAVAAIRLSVPAPQGCVTPNSTASSTIVQTVTTPSQLQSGTAAQRGTDNTREKCRKFLTNLLELSSREPKPVERNVRTLIQELIDSKVEPEEFCDRLERLLNASPQPCLIGFLKKSLPLLRAAMIAKETSIEGIRPPPAPSQSQATVVLAAPSAVVQTQIQNNQVRPVQLSTMQHMRVVPQTTTLPQGARPQQQMSRLLTPVRLQTTSNAGTLPTGPVSGMKVVTTSSIPTVATAVRIQSPLPTSVTVADTTSTAVVTTVQLVPSTNVVTTSTVRLSTPVRPTMVKSLPIKMTAATTTPSIRATSVMSATSKATTPTTVAAKNTSAFVSKSPMPTGTTKQQTTVSQSKTASKERDRKSAIASASTAVTSAAVTALAGGYVGEDDVNDVAAMAGVNLAEETQRILGPSEFVGTQIRSCKDETFLHTHPLTMRIAEIAKKHGLDEPNSDVVALVSHAAQERLKNILEKLNVIAEHRVDFNKADKKYEISHDIRGQLRCLEELDKVERKRHDEMERELLLRAAKSRSKSEDPEQVKLKAKAKELQRAEMEELRQREANMTALQAIGPRKKIKLDTADGQSTFNFAGNPSTNTGANRLSLTNRPRLKRVTIRDFLYVMEKEKHINRSPFLYRSYLK